MYTSVSVSHMSYIRALLLENKNECPSCLKINPTTPISFTHLSGYNIFHSYHTFARDHPSKMTDPPSFTLDIGLAVAHFFGKNFHSSLRILRGGEPYYSFIKVVMLTFVCMKCFVFARKCWLSASSVRFCLYRDWSTIPSQIVSRYNWTIVCL